MLTKFLNSIDSPAPRRQPIGQAPSNKRFRKKLHVTAAAIIIITVVTATIFLVPSSEAEIISLGVHYVPGEKLTYDITISASSQIGKSSTNFTTQITLTVEVLSINEDTYTLKYTTASSMADNSTSTSYLMNVKEADIINLLTLLPVAFQQYPEYAEYANSGSPIETAFFNQSEAKVGDTWRIPATCAVTATPEAEIIVKFVTIQNLEVKAGNFKVFKIEFTRTSSQQIQNQFDNLEYVGVSGESYLEFGSCKQIQSTVQFNMTTSLGVNSGYSSAVTTFSSTLIKDEKP
ncbi:hypothetical protein JW988_06210 [Candidatus Bathyarchaeota archaeon]|nr:hypothetical protein [Candidatus Bathyarchaeota archaeon]